MKKVHPLIITAIGTVLAVVVALLNYFEPFAEKSASFIVWLVLSPIWAFSVLPSYFYGCYLFLKSSEKHSDEENMRRGARLGMIYGFDIFILPMLIAPAFAVMYYVTIIKESLTDKSRGDGK